MRVEIYGLTLESPKVTVHLWSPWRCSQLEHRLFEAVKSVQGISYDPTPDELKLHITEAEPCRQAVQAIARVLKGWQEEAVDTGKDEHRSWRWLLEADVDANGYDLQGEKANFWAYIRLAIEQGQPGEPEKGEDIDLNGFGLSIHRVKG